MAQSAAMAPAGLLVLRVVLAALVAVHAAHWLFGSFSGAALGPGGLTATTTYFAATGLRSAFLFVLAAGIAQLAGSGLLVFGLFTRVVSIVLIVVEVVRLSFDSARWGFFLNWALDPTRGHGMEHAVLVMAALACLALAGAGEWSIDGVRDRTRAARISGRARIRDHA
jgi:putative oxidoreductase